MVSKVLWVTTTEGVYPYRENEDGQFPLIGGNWFIDDSYMGRVLKVSTTKGE